MARLRTLSVTGPDGPRDILILDGLTAGQMSTNIEAGDLAALGIPPILAFDYEVDLPEVGDTETP